MDDCQEEYIMIKTVVIGLGKGLTYHIPTIVEHPGFELAAVVDINKEKVSATAEKYSVKGFTDVYEMMNVIRPELVVIASPTQFHSTQAIAAMKQGIDVFLEKPMAASYQEALAIYETQKKTGKKLMVFQPHRVRADFMTVKKVMESGVLGNVYLIKRRMTCFYIRTNWQAYKENGGGTLYNHGSHYIDELMYLTGGKPVTVSCELARVAATGDADDFAKVLIKSDTHIIFDIDMSMTNAYSPIPWELYGNRGSAVFTKNGEGKGVIRARYYAIDEEMPQNCYIPTANPNDPAKYPWLIADFEIKPEYEVNFYDKCYEYFALGKEPLVPLTDTLCVMETLQRCHEAAGRF